MEYKQPKTLMEAIKYFADPKITLDYFVQIRWPEGVACPRCGSKSVAFLANQHRWQCNTKHPRRQFSAKVGTIFEESPLPLEKWLVCVWLEVNAENSISSCELARALGITQKSAWFMLHRARFALKQKTFEKIGGKGEIVEADETFIGGLSRNMHKSKRAKLRGTGGMDKTPVMGLLARHIEDAPSYIRATVLPNVQRATLHDVIHKNVEPGTQVFTDAWKAYKQMDPAFFHDFIDHAEAYVKGAVHTNGLENFWALFKRCIKGTHVSIEPFHLEAYVDSEAFRFNNRTTNDSGRFIVAMPNVVGKRLKYKTLIGTDQAQEGSLGNGNDAGSASPAN
jgi:transposase-like protein